MYTPSDTGLEWLGEGPLYKSVSSKRQGGPNCGYYSSHFRAIIEVRPGALVQIWHPPDHKWET